MVDWHSKMPAEPTTTTVPSAAATFASAAENFASAAAFEMPHKEVKKSVIRQCVGEHGLVGTVPSDTRRTRFSLALLLYGSFCGLFRLFSSKCI